MNATPPSTAGAVRLTLDLVRLRGDPQDFVYSPLRLAALLVACIAFDLITAEAFGQSDNALAHSLVGEGLALALCWIALRIRGLDQRYVQTATALLACSLVLTLVQYPLALLFVPPGADAAAHSPPTPVDGSQRLLVIAFFAMLAWQTLVNAHIMRHAMEATYGFAVTLVVTWFVASLAIDRILFGAR